jgi:hypothetical protein
MLSLLNDIFYSSSPPPELNKVIINKDEYIKTHLTYLLNDLEHYYTCGCGFKQHKQYIITTQNNKDMFLILQEEFIDILQEYSQHYFTVMSFHNYLVFSFLFPKKIQT